MNPDIFMTYEKISMLPGQVRSLYEKLGITISKESDLEKMLLLCSNINNDTKTHIDLLETNKAKRVLETIITSKSETNLYEPLKRIATSLLETKTEKHSLGKDALYELEFIQYIKHRQLTARLGEPDIIVDSPFGEYYIACKTINSLNNFEGQLRSAYHQIAKLGVGCIAFNLEPHMATNEPLVVNSPKEARMQLDSCIRDIITPQKPLLRRKLKDERFDGIVFQMSCTIDCANSNSSLDIFTHSYYFCDAQLQKKLSYDRFSGFTHSMQGDLAGYYHDQT